MYPASSRLDTGTRTATARQLPDSCPFLDAVAQARAAIGKQRRQAAEDP